MRPSPSRALKLAPGPVDRSPSPEPAPPAVVEPVTGARVPWPAVERVVGARVP
ncbi:hypothetical protein [Thermaerobacter marianensis]|uniref:hypothetical protein n=1 Tax=Thermaerobacter marianensis TaxID=73919 RepID=UPI00145ED8A9|nr:hypothetical protein [Thermaerobacter marianensis]